MKGFSGESGLALKERWSWVWVIPPSKQTLAAFRCGCPYQWPFYEERAVAFETFKSRWKAYSVITSYCPQGLNLFLQTSASIAVSFAGNYRGERCKGTLKNVVKTPAFSLASHSVLVTPLPNTGALVHWGSSVLFSFPPMKRLMNKIAHNDNFIEDHTLYSVLVPYVSSV